MLQKLASHLQTKATSFFLYVFHWKDTFGLNPSLHSGKVQIPHPWEGHLCQIPYSLVMEDSQMPVSCLVLGCCSFKLIGA